MGGVMMHGLTHRWMRFLECIHTFSPQHSRTGFRWSADIWRVGKAPIDQRFINGLNRKRKMF
jgi:hypothetical protein